ncbi:hypothetical protein [uncultured Sphingomonas sp.]|uniref:hypothetical protein n=1 Tax=uncultured Sphingomonas sp. TaxID=158754 RepID=UPI0035CA91F2
MAGLTHYVDDGRLARGQQQRGRALAAQHRHRRQELAVRGFEQVGDRAATIYSLVEMAKLSAVDP